MSLSAITSPMPVNDEINKGLNLSRPNLLRHQHLIFEANFNEDITNALRPAQPGLGRNIPHANLHTLKLHWFCPKTQLFTQDTTVTKYQTADYLIQALKIYKYTTKFTTFIFSLELVVHLYISMYISRVNYAVLSNNDQDMQPLYELVTLH